MMMRITNTVLNMTKPQHSIATETCQESAPGGGNHK